MKEEVFFGEGMKKVKSDYPDLYNAIVGLNEAAYTGKAIDYRTQKLIALGINAAASDDRATKKQMMSAIKEFGITKDEIVDVLRVVLLTSGMPPFNKAIK
ncbi:MAG TPA: carboxymuconolactone decarboxylase family protein, partial [Methanotrichaceae archaeon]|nr:carboxymuconolactone decarboxylase family protein [Methanotrichaceae archaeon]